MFSPYANSYILHRDNFFIKHAYAETGTTATLAGSGAAEGSNSMTLSSGEGSLFSAGDAFTLDYSGTGCSDGDIIIVAAVSGDTLRFARPLEHDYPSGSIITKVLYKIEDIAVGTLDSPRTISVPAFCSGTTNVTMIIISGESVLEPSFSKFIGVPALQNGFCIVHNDGVTSVKCVIKSNGDMLEYFGADNVSMLEKAPAGNWFVNAMLPVAEHTSGCISLRNGDRIDFTWYDDLTSIVNGEIIVQGYYID